MMKIILRQKITRTRNFLNNTYRTLDGSRLLTVLGLIMMCAGLTFAQKNDQPFASLWQNEPFASQDLSKEIISKRDAFSKHFLNDNGNITAHIASGQINYRENGQWLTIYHTISPNANGFENVHNSHKTYYPAFSNGSLKTVLKNGETIRDMIGMNLHFRVNGEKVHTKAIQNKKGNATFNKLTYPNVYGNGIDLQLTQETSIRKMDYVIQNRQAIGNIPANASHLVFEETIELPDGWIAELKSNIILLKDSKGEIQAAYEKPFIEDASDLEKPAKNEDAAKKGADLKNSGEYTIEQNGRLLTIQTAVTIEWITSAARQFPLKIDPTLNVSPNNAANWTGNVWADGEYGNLNIYTGYYAATWVQGAIRFNSSSIPAGATVNTATGYINILAGYTTGIATRTWALANSSDPLGVPVGITSQGLALYNSMTAAHSATTTITGLGWRSSLFAASGRTYLQNSFANGFFAMGLYAMGSYSNGQYMEVAGYTSANKPYIAIDYTVPASMVCATLTNLTASLGTPFNGLSHYLNLNWNVLTGATGYDVQFSTDNITFTNATPASVTTNSAVLNAGDVPNTRYWFRVRAKDAVQTCDWTYSSPIYTAADVPSVPLLTNAVGTSLDLTLQAETPVANPAITTYSIVCSTTGQFVQADGTLGATEVFRTKADWGTVHVTGLTTGTEYCFYAKARNGDGHVVSGAASISGTETFVSNANFNATSASPTNKWWTPPTPTSGSPMVYSASGSDCSDGYVGFSGSLNNFFGSFLRSPQQNCTGLNEVTLTFDLSNSFISGQTDNNFRFYIWDGAAYRNPPTTVKIGSNTYTPQTVNNYFYIFDMVRTCQQVTVTFDISGITNKSTMLFFLEAKCAYNNSNVFSFKLDNISILQKAPTACSMLASAPTPVFHNVGGSQQIVFDNARYSTDQPVFRVSHPGGSTATNYQIEMNTKEDFTGTSIVQNFAGAYPAQTPTNFLFSSASGQLVNLTTYYVRARLNTGSGYGSWSTKLHSYTYDTGKPYPNWFQTTTPQFLTDALNGTETSNHAVTLTQPAAVTNPFTNPSFETGTGWTSYVTGGSDLIITPSDGNNWKSAGTKAGRMYMFGGYPFSGDVAIISQTVDLTNVEQIIFDAQSHYGQNLTSSLATGGTLRLIIGGTSSNTAGTVYATINHCVGGSASCSNETLNVTANIALANRAPNQVVKFVWTGFSQGDLGGALVSFMVDNVRAGASQTKSGTITSTPIRLASVQGATGYKELVWNQELAGGSLNFDLQTYNTLTSSWETPAGFAGIQDLTSNGEKSFNLQSANFPAYDSIRIVGYFNGTAGALKMNDWAIYFTQPVTPLPVVLTSFTASCERAVKLSWSTASEQNSDVFILEKSQNLIDWIFVSDHTAAGNSSIKTNYTASDENPWHDVAYYRLRQLDFNGQQKIYGPISVSCDANESSMTVYPNPNQGDFTIEITSAANMRDVQLYLTDLTGKTITSRTVNIQAGTTQIFLEGLDLQMGTYLIQFEGADNQLKPAKVVVNR